MFKVIELNSSDDEEIQEIPQAKSAESTTTKAVAEKNANDTKCATTEKVGTEICVSSEISPMQLEQQRTHRRKTIHQMVRSSTDFEFETLSLQERLKRDNANLQLQNKEIVKAKEMKKISILASKPLTAQQIFKKEFDKYVNQEDTRDLIREIAAERLRINQILLLNGMPEIKFSLYTQPERVEFQLTDRFRQHDIRLQSLNSNNPKD